jgi:Transposase zinc-ribbon domain
MSEFFERFGTDAQCQAALQAVRWPNGFVCPGCADAARTSFVHAGLTYGQCAACENQGSQISGAVFTPNKRGL